MVEAAAGLVVLCGTDEDGGGRGWGGLPVYEALGPGGIPSADVADGSELYNLVGDGEQAGHGAEGLSSEILVESGRDDLVSGVGEALKGVRYSCVEKLRLFYGHEVRPRPDGRE